MDKKLLLKGLKIILNICIPFPDSCISEQYMEIEKILPFDFYSSSKRSIRTFFVFSSIRKRLSVLSPTSQRIVSPEHNT